MWIENKIAVGTYVLRIICTADGPNLANRYTTRVWCYQGRRPGSAGGFPALYGSETPRLENVQNIIHQHAPKAFVTIEDVRSSEMGFFPIDKNPQAQFFQGKKSK
jgi:hypothetical protein